jgi:hypothetical protein
MMNFLSEEQFNKFNQEKTDLNFNYDLYRLCHRQLELFNDNRDGFYSEAKKYLSDEEKLKYAFECAHFVSEQLELKSKIQVIVDKIYDFETSNQELPELKQIDFLKLIDAEINSGMLLRINGVEGGEVQYVPDYMEELIYAISQAEERQEERLDSEQFKEAMPYYTALLGEQPFLDLPIHQQQLAAHIFKESTISYNVEELMEFNEDDPAYLKKFEVWDKEKVFEQAKKDYHHYINDYVPSVDRRVYIERSNLDEVVRGIDRKLIEVVKENFRHVNAEAIEAIVATNQITSGSRIINREQQVKAHSI